MVEKPISFFGEESISGNLSWLPDNEGEIEFEIILGQVKGEIYKNNNTQRVNTRIEKKTIRALIVDSFQGGNIAISEMLLTGTQVLICRAFFSIQA